MAHFHYVLSLGAVFALFAGWYYWSPKFLGVMYNEKLGQLQFWLMFIGVNLTFMPLHFLGLQGMPRRIPDYPDAFASWNIIASFGSIISLVASFLFLFIVYRQLTDHVVVYKNPWSLPEYFQSLLVFSNNSRFAHSLEWSLESPPHHHSFNTLPAQS